MEVGTNAIMQCEFAHAGNGRRTIVVEFKIAQFCQKMETVFISRLFRIKAAGGGRFICLISGGSEMSDEEE
jgi:hypothetical protein